MDTNVEPLDAKTYNDILDREDDPTIGPLARAVRWLVESAEEWFGIDSDELYDDDDPDEDANDQPVAKSFESLVRDLHASIANPLAKGGAPQVRKETVAEIDRLLIKAVRQMQSVRSTFRKRSSA